MIRSMRRGATVLGAAVVLVWFGVWLAAPYVSAAAFLLDLGGSTSWARRVMPARVQDVWTRDLSVPTRYGSIAARLYAPRSPSGRHLIVFPGVHAGGVDEPRLAAFSRRLAGTGITVLSVPLPELRRYRVTPASTDMIEDAIQWFDGDRALAPDGRVDVAGVSFAGGLVLVAAGRPALAGKVRSIVSIGGHADLPRVMTYLCTGHVPGGSVMRPHDYGVIVLVLAAIPRLVPADQVELTRDAVLTFLDASSFENMDRAKSAALFADARRMAAAAPEPARTLLMRVNDRNVAMLGPQLLPYLEELGGAAALSPARSPATRAPVFLIHGQADTVIPSAETPLLADYLRRSGNEQVRWLLTPLLSHADLQPPHALDAWRLIRFWKDMLNDR
jgi:pimeloyl-ACP methyl ester carboxylesterase